jgi:hypothetical protein
MKKSFQRNVEKKNRARYNNAWAIIVVRVLMNDSKTISRWGLGPILWGIKDLT